MTSFGDKVIPKDTGTRRHIITLTLCKFPKTYRTENCDINCQTHSIKSYQAYFNYIRLTFENENRFFYVKIKILIDLYTLPKQMVSTAVGDPGRIVLTSG